MIVETYPSNEELEKYKVPAIEAIGSRRSIRWYNPNKPVEKWKIAVILEAARQASTVGNYCGVGAVVLYREQHPELWEFVSDWSQIQTQQAPVLIFWYYDMAAWDTQGHRIHDLMRVGALDRAHGWDYDRVCNMFPLPKVLPDVILHRISAIDLGNATQNAMIAAQALGLATCLNGVGGAVRRKLPELLNLPRTAVFCWMMTVGYPLEDPKAGGQRPRRPFEEMFFEGKYGNPFKVDEKTKEIMRKLKLIQEPGPLPRRLEEINTLTKAVGLGDEWLTDWKLEPPGSIKPGVIRDPPLQKLSKDEVIKTVFRATPTVLREKAEEYRKAKKIVE
ncbi:MAG: nitroreductase family protein [Archaeoglobaceae archaeon]